MGDAAPRVSVIVPVRDRRALLRECLDALAAQSFDGFEVIVVDDGSTDGSGDEARAADGRDGLRVRVLETSGAGAVAARRAGIDASTAPYVAFTDSDCRPARDWLTAGVAALDDGADVVNGLTRPARSPRPLERTMGSGNEGLYPTCNLFVRRSAYDAVDGFDAVAAERLGFRFNRRARGLGFGEDTILAWRIRRKGAARFVPEAEVTHHVFPPDLTESFSRAWMCGAFPALVRDVPELRETLLTRRLIVGEPERWLAVAATVAALARRPRLAALAVAAWTWRRSRRRSTAGGRGAALAALPAELALDVVTSAGLVVGSATARTVVL